MWTAGSAELRIKDRREKNYNTKSDCWESESFVQLLNTQSILGTLYHIRLQNSSGGSLLKDSLTGNRFVLFAPFITGMNKTGAFRTLSYSTIKLFFWINWRYSAIWRFLPSHNCINSLEQNVCAYAKRFLPNISQGISDVHLCRKRSRFFS